MTQINANNFNSFSRPRRPPVLSVFLFLPVLYFFSCAGLPPAGLPDGGIREIEKTEGIEKIAEIEEVEEIEKIERIEKTEEIEEIEKGKTEETAVPGPGIETVPPRADYLTIVAVGDNLIHDSILSACYKNGVYNFNSIYDKIRGYILPTDIAFVNQETILGNAALGYSGYPLFCTPPEAGAALAAAGFNVINHATNHVLDRGEAGILSSIHYWESRGDVHYLGIHRNAAERADRKVIVSMNNFSVGFLAYTCSTNGIPVPRGRPHLVSLAEREKMAAEIDSLRPLCDYLVVSMHWGDEYRSDPSAEQERLAAFLAEHRVDLVIGHHPHVLGPMRITGRPDGGSMTVFFSLGNFFAAHAQPVKESLLGGIMYIRLKKSEGKITAEETGLIPVITHFDTRRSDFTVYPLHEYTEELAARHWKRAGDREMTPDYFINKARTLFGSALIRGR
jgi:poly-gamma-glutamate synthesis protein (capsule biosynthesis protein)